MPNSHSFTVTARSGVLRALETECYVSQAFDPVDQVALANSLKFHKFKAIWDTGATNSAVTENVVSACGLQPIGMTRVEGVNSSKDSETFLVNIILPNGVGFPNIRVTSGILGGDCDLLIGMDIITTGDFSVTNKNGKTIFSFRVPSQIHTDYVKEHQAQELKDHFKHGGSKKGRKRGGKNKRER